MTPSISETVYIPEYLNDKIVNYYNQNVVSSKKLEAVQSYLYILKANLVSNEHFGKETRIQTFGSMCNGMASEASDLDISISFGNQEKYERDYKILLLEQMLVPLTELGCTDIQPILEAIVPIIKCNWKDENTKVELEIDISIYNPLAVRNTSLLQHYCLWDIRLPQLAFYIKKFAKEQEITGAYKRFLSSYALVIMLVRYLQEVEVLPNLQKDFRKEEDVNIISEGYDSYFATQVIPNWSSNKSSVAELFCGFLEFYSKYDYDNVIRIDRRKQCSQYKKGWDFAIGVQDPFLFNRNVAGMVSKSNVWTIVEVFRKEAQIIRNECNFTVSAPISRKTTVTQISSSKLDRKRRCRSPSESSTPIKRNKQQ